MNEKILQMAYTVDRFQEEYFSGKKSLRETTRKELLENIRKFEPASEKVVKFSEVQNKTMQFGYIKEPYYDLRLLAFYGKGIIVPIIKSTRSFSAKISLPKEKLARLISEKTEDLNLTNAKKLDYRELLNRLIFLDPEAKMLLEDFSLKETSSIRKGKVTNKGYYYDNISSLEDIHKAILANAEEKALLFNSVLCKKDELEQLFQYANAEIICKQQESLIKNISTKLKSKVKRILQSGDDGLGYYTLATTSTASFNKTASYYYLTYRLLYVS